MVDQERSTLFIDLMVWVGTISCEFSVPVISMLKDINTTGIKISRMKIP